MSTREESIELLKATHNFPCSFTFKVIGKSTDQFRASVLEVIVRYTKEEQPPHTIRETPGGRHVSITAEPFIAEAVHVLEIYEQLQALDDVVMLL